MKFFDRNEYDHGEEAVVPAIVQKAKDAFEDMGWLTVLGALWCILAPFMGVQALSEYAIVELRKKRDQLKQNLSWVKSKTAKKIDSSTDEGMSLENSDPDDKGSSSECAAPDIQGKAEDDQPSKAKKDSQRSTEESSPEKEEEQ